MTVQYRRTTGSSTFIACITSEGEREISRPISRADARSSVFAERIRKYEHVCESQVRGARVRRSR